MKTSEQIADLAKALAEAQSEIQPPAKDKTARVKTKAGGEYTFDYVDLASVLDAVRGPLAKHGLSISQGTAGENGKTALETRLMHVSGQWMESAYPLSFQGSAQEKGSELTYARRYALCAMLGIAAEADDDGNAASGNRASVTSRQRQQPRNQVDEAMENNARGDPDENEMYRIALKEAFEACGFSSSEMVKVVKDVLNAKKKAHLTDLDAKQRAGFIEAIKAGKFDSMKKEAAHA